MSQTTLRTQLEALECHFTWGIDYRSRSKLLRLRDNQEDIGTEVGYQWLGHIYNMQAYIHYQLSSQDETLGSTTHDALCCFSKAPEAFRQIRNTVSDEGPWLLVNYSNMAWLHFHLGEQEKSQEYVSKVEALLQAYPSPSPDELHAEVYAEKAWTLMISGPDRQQEAEEYFQKAISMEPDRVEWHTSQALAIASASRDDCTPIQEAELLKKLKTAMENDPENTYVAAVYLDSLANTGKVIEDEAHELAQRVLQKPGSSYSGIRPLLKLYRMHLSFDEAIGLAKEALERHPHGPNDNRYLKSCLATCYKWKIYSDRGNLLNQSLTDRAISLFEEVISLYRCSSSSYKTNLSLAGMYVESTQYKEKADLIYKKMLESNLEPKELQMVCNRYAKYLNYHLKDHYRSVEYHMKVAEIPLPSKFRQDSIKILTQIQSRGRNKRCPEIQDFLATLQKEPDTIAVGTMGAGGATAPLFPRYPPTPLGQEVEGVEIELRPAWSKVVPAAMPATP